MKSKETNSRRKRLILCGAATAAGTLIAWGAASARGLGPGIGTAMALRYWSDGCFVSAVLIGGIGAFDAQTPVWNDHVAPNLSDGDTVFTLATGGRPLDPADPLALNDVLAAGADMVTRAIVRAVRTAEPVDGPGGAWPSYGELYGPS